MSSTNKEEKYDQPLLVSSDWAIWIYEHISSSEGDLCSQLVIGGGCFCSVCAYTYKVSFEDLGLVTHYVIIQFFSRSIVPSFFGWVLYPVVLRDWSWLCPGIIPGYVQGTIWGTAVEPRLYAG